MGPVAQHARLRIGCGPHRTTPDRPCPAREAAEAPDGVALDVEVGEPDVGRSIPSARAPIARNTVEAVKASHPLLLGYKDRATIGDPTFPAQSLANYVVGASGPEALDLVAQVARLLRDDDAGLCWMAADMVEPLVDLHWSEIAAALEDEARRSAALRRALSCCAFDDSVPTDVVRRLTALEDPDPLRLEGS